MTPSPLSKDLATECRHSFLIDIFSTSTGARINQIREALAVFNFSKIRAEAHTIKGVAREVGADAVAQACQELEIVSDLQDILLVAARLKVVQERFEEIRSAMASYSTGL